MPSAREARTDRRFTLGVNYWPRRKAMGWWSSFDRAEVDDEFALIAELGLDVVRLFLLWDDWQPAPTRVDGARLRDLGDVCDVAARHGLGLDVTFFTGHMSGPNWAPGWLLDDGPYPAAGPARQLVSGGVPVDSAYRNMFTDPTALAAQRLLLRSVVEAYRDHEALWLWNLGNEPDLFAWPPSARAGRAWVAEMTALIHDLDDEHPVTCGLHLPSLLENNGLRVHDVFAETDVAVMHAYPMYTPWARGPLDPELVPFSCALTSALCGKPTLMEEWGGPTLPPGEASRVVTWTRRGQQRSQFMASEEDLDGYVTAVLPRLVAAGAAGAMLWCFADYHESLWDRPPCDEALHERSFGLVRSDGSPKPHARTLARFARTAPQRRSESLDRVVLDVTPEAYYRAPEEHARRLYQAYLED